MADFERAKQLFPSIGMGPEEMERRMEADPRIMWRLLYDIFDKVQTEEERAKGQVRTGRRRRRPATREEILEVAIPTNISHDPFPLALTKLVGNRSQRAFAMRMHTNQSMISRLLAGKVEPDRYLMEAAARAGEVQPWYFLEYRSLMAAEYIEQACRAHPHLSVSVLQLIGEL